MRRFAFISRHQPTDAQVKMASRTEIALHWVGDDDAFNPMHTAHQMHQDGFDGAVVVHPALALHLISAGFDVGVFENAMRPIEGGKPQFEAKSLQVFSMADGFCRNVSE